MTNQQPSASFSPTQVSTWPSANLEGIPSRTGVSTCDRSEEPSEGSWWSARVSWQLPSLLGLALCGILAAVDVSAQPAGVVRGWVDYLGPERIVGWAGTSAGEALWVHVYEGTTYIVSTPSNTLRRDDAAALCGGNPWVGFSVGLPRLAGGSHTLRAYVSTSRTPSTAVGLAGATTMRMPNAEFTGPSPFGVVETIAPGRITGWACDPDSPKNPIRLQVLVQYDCRGDFYPIADGTTGIARMIPFAGANARPGFSIALPRLVGGRHNVVVRGINVGAGESRLLEKFGNLWFSDFPHLESVNDDAGFAYAPVCWTTDPGLGASWNTSGCPPWSPNSPIWAMFISRPNATIPIPQPQPGYPGPAAYVRYAPDPKGGMFFAVNNGLAPAPWYINAQGMRTIMPEVRFSGSSRLLLDAELSVIPGTLALGGTSPDPRQGSPWVHVMVSPVFYDEVARKTYFIEVVPVLRDRVGGTTVGQIGNPLGDPNARLDIRDPRIAPYVSLPSAMLEGESRRMWMDLKGMFRSVFPGVEPSHVIFTGVYVGTEQYGPSQVALRFSRLAVHAD